MSIRVAILVLRLRLKSHRDGLFAPLFALRRLVGPLAMTIARRRRFCGRCIADERLLVRGQQRAFPVQTRRCGKARRIRIDVSVHVARFRRMAASRPTLIAILPTGRYDHVKSGHAESRRTRRRLRSQMIEARLPLHRRCTVGLTTSSKLNEGIRARRAFLAAAI